MGKYKYKYVTVNINGQNIRLERTSNNIVSVSRPRLWKHTVNLKHINYDIELMPLSNDSKLKLKEAICELVYPKETTLWSNANEP